MHSEQPSTVDVKAIEQRILVLPSTSADGVAMGKLFDTHHILFVICRSMAAVCQLHREGAGSVLLSEEAISADPAELIACVAAQPVWSDLPIIILSRSGRETAA